MQKFEKTKLAQDGMKWNRKCGKIYYVKEHEMLVKSCLQTQDWMVQKKVNTQSVQIFIFTSKIILFLLFFTSASVNNYHIINRE